MSNNFCSNCKFAKLIDDIQGFKIFCLKNTKIKKNRGAVPFSLRIRKLSALACINFEEKEN